MEITGELITAEVTEIDRERQATLDMIYGIAFHMKSAETEAIECPDEVGRKLFRDIATEYRNLVVMLHATTDGSDQSQESMDIFYRKKADQCFDMRTMEAKAAKDQEQSVRATLGDLQYFLRYMESYLSASLAKVDDLTSRINLDNSAKMFGQIGGIFQRRESGDVDYLSWAMAEWKAQCSVHLDNPTIDL